MFRAILRSITKLPKLTDFNTYMFVAPHPDDIEVGCGATVARLTSEGKKVVFVVATDGWVGSINPALSGEALVGVRQQECRAAAAILGVKEVVFMPFADGAFYDEHQLRVSLAEQIVIHKPDVLFAPDYTVPTECHPDHIKVGQSATYAACATAPWSALMNNVGIADTHSVKLLAYYYTHKPNAYLPIGKYFAVQTQAMQQFTSQFTPAQLNDIEKYRKLRALRFGLRCLRGKCDGFRLLNPIRMHCFPEGAEI